MSSLHALDVTLTDDDLAELDEALPAGAVVRAPPPPVPIDADGEVALFVGYPGAGKSALAESWVSRGYTRLNRDAEGGTLADLLPELDRRLASGERRLVLDNTYPRRESRFDVIETARRHGVPVRCLWLETTLEQAQVNAVRRMVARHGRLLEPAEMKSSKDPNDFTPEAQFRYRRELEPPRPEEDFSEIEKVPFVRREEPRNEKAVFLDELGSIEVLRRYVENDYRVIQVKYQPDQAGTPETETRVDVDGLRFALPTGQHFAGNAKLHPAFQTPGMDMRAGNFLVTDIQWGVALRAPVQGPMKRHMRWHHGVVP